MKPSKRNRKVDPQLEYQAAVAYYRRTVWNHVKNTPLAGPASHLATLAYLRVSKAQGTLRRHAIEHGNWDFIADPEIEKLKPQRLQADDTIAPEQLAALAATRLKTSKTESIERALEEAHQMLQAARNYLRKLPQAGQGDEEDLDAFDDNTTVSFEEILNSMGKPRSLPLFLTIQKNRNEGKLGQRGLEQALSRYAQRQENKDIQNQIRSAVKNKRISCRLLEEARWEGFMKHFKG